MSIKSIIDRLSLIENQESTNPGKISSNMTPADRAWFEGHRAGLSRNASTNPYNSKSDAECFKAWQAGFHDGDLERKEPVREMQGVAEAAKWRSHPDAWDEYEPVAKSDKGHDDLLRRPMGYADKETGKLTPDSVKTQKARARFNIGKHGKSNLPEEEEGVAEGRFTINRKTGAKLDPKTGIAIPGTSNADRAAQRAAQRGAYRHYEREEKLNELRTEPIEQWDAFPAVSNFIESGEADGFTYFKRGMLNINGITVASAKCGVYTSYGPEDDLGLEFDPENPEERVEDIVHVVVYRDPKNPKNIVVHHSSGLSEGESTQGVAEGSMKRITGYRVVDKDGKGVKGKDGKVIFIPVKDFEQAGRYYELRGYEFKPVWDDEQGVSEGSDAPQWRVEQSHATGRYHVVKGYTDKSRRVWKSKSGAGDFNKKEDAEAKAQELNQDVAEGKFTVNAKTGAKLDPRTGAEIPGSIKPPKIPAPKPKAPAAPKLTYDTVWRQVEHVVGQIYPDGDPIDWLLPWFRKQGIADHKVGDILEKAARKNGYKDIYDYYNHFGDDLGYDKVDRFDPYGEEDGLGEARVPQLPTNGADYSNHDTEHLKTMLRPGIMHRNENKFKALIRKELKKREQQSQQGVAEGSDAPYWRVEQSHATGRYHVVKGYTDKSRRVWKSKSGAGDFNKKEDAEAKAQELNQGVAEGESDDAIWGPQGNFAGSEPRVELGNVTMKKIQVGDIVKYFGEKAEVLELGPTQARISTNGKILNVRKSDLNRLGQGVAEGSEQKTFTVVYYSPKTDRNVTKNIKAATESAVWDKLESKGMQVVSVKAQSVSEELDSDQKRVGQLGPTEKVKNNNIGKLVGANESLDISNKPQNLRGWMKSVEQEIITEVALDSSQLAIPSIKPTGSTVSTTVKTPQASSSASTSPTATASVIDFKDPNDPLKAALQKAIQNKSVTALGEDDLDEVIDKSTPVADIIADFVHSKDSRFADKSKKERTKMALGAYYAQHPELAKKEESVMESKQTVMESTLDEVISRYPHEHKACQEGWGMDENLYEALCDHYFKEGRIPYKIWHGPLEELRGCVEECYMQDTNPQPVVDEGLIGGALGAAAGAVLTKTPSGAVTGARIGSELQNALTDDYEEEIDESGLAHQYMIGDRVYHGNKEGRVYDMRGDTVIVDLANGDRDVWPAREVSSTPQGMLSTLGRDARQIGKGLRGFLTGNNELDEESMALEMTDITKEMEENMYESEEKWIQKAVKHPGAFTKKAQAAGKSVSAFAKEKAHAPGTLGKQARLAQTLKKINKESMGEQHVMENELDAILARHAKAVNDFKQGGDLHYDLESDLWGYYFDRGDIRNYNANAGPWISQKLADYLGLNEQDVAEGSESESDYDARMRRLAATYNAMSDEKKERMSKIPGWSDQMKQAIAHVKKHSKNNQQGVAEGTFDDQDFRPKTNRDRFMQAMAPRIDEKALMRKVAKVVNNPVFTEHTILNIVDAGDTITHPVGRYIQKEFDELQYDLGRAYEDNPMGVAEKLLQQLKTIPQGVAEAKGLQKRVKVVKGEHTGQTGWIRQVKHGAFKGAPKSYYVDLDNGKQADNLPSTALRLDKEQGVMEGSYDNAMWGLQQTVDFAKQHGYRIFRSRNGQKMRFVNNKLNHEIRARVDNDGDSINVNFIDYLTGMSGNDDAHYFAAVFQRAYEQALADYEYNKSSEQERDMMEGVEERPYVCVHAKKGKCSVTASSSYEAAKKAAQKWGLKSTAGIDAHVADKPKDPASIGEGVAEGSQPDNECTTCDGTGIGQYGDPDTSKCHACGGSGKKGGNRLNRNFNRFARYRDEEDDEGEMDNFRKNLGGVAEGKTLDTDKGRIHKGDYGNSDSDSKPSASKPASRGRPKKDIESDTGPKFSDSAKDFFGIKKVDHKKLPGKAAVRHKIKDESLDAQMEGWNRELNTLLTEGLTVSTSTGQQGMPDSVSVSATDTDAHNLLQIIQRAGLTGGIKGADAAKDDTAGVISVEPVSSDEVMSNLAPEQEDDGEEAFGFLKKMLGARQTASSGYSAYKPAAGCDECGSDECECSQEEVEEGGNAFTYALAKAKADGVQPGEKIKVGGREYPVKEEQDSDEEGEWQGTGETDMAAAAAQNADAREDAETEKETAMAEGEETCNECGGLMEEGHTCSTQELNEWANSRVGGDEEQFQTEMDFMLNLISGGLNGKKTQHKHGYRFGDNPMSTPMEQELDINSIKRLSGIK